MPDKTRIIKKKWPHPGLIRELIESQENEVTHQFSTRLLEPGVHPFKLALQNLSPKERAAYILRYQQHHSSAQIAIMLGISPESLNQLFERISNKLSSGIYKHFRLN